MDITPRECMHIFVLYQHYDTKQCEIAEIVGVGLGSVSRIIKHWFVDTETKIEKVEEKERHLFSSPK